MQHLFPFPLHFWLLGNGWYDYECSWLKLTAVRTCNDTEFSAGHNWKQLLIILLLLLVVGIGLWWILDSESKSQLTLNLNSECTSVYTTQILLICVYSVYYITVDLEIFTFSWYCHSTYLWHYSVSFCTVVVVCIYVTQILTLYSIHIINKFYSCVFSVLLQVSNLITWSIYSHPLTTSFTLSCTQSF